MFGWSCISDLCARRGFDSFVILEHHPVRLGDDASPGSDWEATLGLLRSQPEDVAAVFPGQAVDSSDLRVWPRLDLEGYEDFTGFVMDVIQADLWEVFTSTHFHFRSAEGLPPLRPPTVSADAPGATSAPGSRRD